MPPPATLGTGFDGLIGTQWEEVGPGRVSGRLTVAAEHLQPYGIVHGGVYAAIAESAAVAGAQASATRLDPRAVARGVENHTTFLRAMRTGTELVVEATPLHAGRRTQSWQVSIREAAGGRDVAASRVRIVVSPGE